MNRNVSIVIGLMFMVQCVFAQKVDVKFRLVGTTSGISLGRITDITRDKNGYMWFTDETNHCITRYDGSHMIRYQHDPHDSTTLGGPHPECILQDSSGIFWIGFYGTGVDRFDPESNTFTHFRYRPNDPGSLLNDSVSAILMDHLGNLWVGSHQGLDRLDQSAGKFIHYRHNPQDPASLSYPLVRTLYEDHQGTLWVGTGTPWDSHVGGGLNRFNRDTGTFLRYLADPKNPHALLNNKIRAIFEDSKGTFWVGTAGDGLHTLDRKAGVFQRYPYDPANPEKLSGAPVTVWDEHITFITEDVAENLWIGSWANGVNRYDPLTRRITHYGRRNGATEIFHDNSCFRAYPTSDGMIWISTQEDNTFMVDLFVNIIPRSKLNGAGANGFYEENPDVLWIATDSGLVRQDFKQDKTELFFHDPKNPNSLSSNRVTQLIRDAQGNFWIGTREGLNRFNPASNNYTRFYHDERKPESLPGDWVHKMAIGADGLWVFTHGGAALLNQQTLAFTPLRHSSKDTSSIGNNIVTGYLLDRSKNTWMVNYFEGGVNRTEGQSLKFRHYLTGETAIGILQDATGVIWVATTHGLFHYEPSGDKFLKYETGNIDMAMDNLITMIADNEDNLWIGSDGGIFRINKNRNQLMLLSRDNGVIPGTLGYFSVFKRQNGQLLFGGNNGYYSFYPERIATSLTTPKIDISQFWVNGQLEKPSPGGLLGKALSATDDIRLSYNENVFAFSFSAIEYRIPESRHAYYQLEKYDDSWHSFGSEEKAYYFNVPPGHYIFRIKAMNSTNGIWTERNISIVISPPWWKTWWAYTLLGLLGLGLAYSGHLVQRGRVIRAEREHTRERELAQAREIEKAYHELRVTQDQLVQSEKMASLGELTAGIAHEIQNPLNFVNNFSEVNSELIEEMKSEIERGNLNEIKALADSIDENEKKIIFHGKRADGIVKGMLQHSRSSSGVKEPTDINALADEYLRLAYHGLRAKDKSFNATSKTDFDQNLTTINVVSQDVGRVILNLITNAFYSVAERAVAMKSAGLDGYVPTVTVSTRRRGDKVEIRVKDNGKGIPQKVLDKIFQPFFTTKPAGKGTGLGLSLSYDIIRSHGGELKVQTQEGEYAEFIVILPENPS